MRNGSLPALLSLVLAAGIAPAGAQPADCAPGPQSPGAVAPLELDLRGLPGVRPGITGQIYVAIPLTSGGMTCTDRNPPPRDVLRGEPGDLLRGPSPDREQ